VNFQRCSKIIRLPVTDTDQALYQSLADSHGRSLSIAPDTRLAVANPRNATPPERDFTCRSHRSSNHTRQFDLPFTRDGKVTRAQTVVFIERADKGKLKRAIEFLAKINIAGTAESSQPDDSNAVGH